MKLKVLELFGGIGACSKALERLGIDCEIVDYVDIDKYATASFNAIHGTSFEPQDIRDWNKNIEVDLIMHGSPCQDFSVAGKQAGGDKGSGTRSSLMYETIRIVEKLKPKYVIWENVKGILSEKHRPNFEAYQRAMTDMHYANFVQVLNAKNYGVPQNRERVFTVSILRHKKMSGWSYPAFKFPLPVPLEKRLKDVLETKVDEKYYIKSKLKLRFSDISKTIRAGGRGSVDRHSWDIVKVGDLDIKGNDQIKRVYDPVGVSPTLSTVQGGNRQPKIVASRGRNPDNPNDRAAGIPTVQRLEAREDGLTNTITTVQKDNYVLKGFRIRKLTPKECWRLMGFDDEDFEKATKVNSNTQLYKQAGNSIVVNVLEAILTNLLKEECNGK